MFAFFSRFFNNAAPRKSMGASGHSTQGMRDTRREILLMAVRDTLRKNAIPADAVTAEIFSAVTGSKARGVHLRLVVKDPQARLVPFAPAFQRALQARVHRLDPLSGQWLTGISWVIQAAEGEGAPLPPASYWQVPVLAGAESTPPMSARTLLDRMFDSNDQAASHSTTDFAATLPMSMSAR